VKSRRASLKVFLSWSGDRSHRVAQALRDWLPGVLQAAQPWLSSQDLSAGERWATALTKALEETRLGIICLTRDNLNAGWLHFEAGALSKVSADSLLCLYSLDVPPNEISGPLSQFQAVPADREGTFKLLRSINQRSTGPSLPDSTLSRAFELWWPQLQPLLAAIPIRPSDVSSVSTLDEKMERALGLLELLVDKESQARLGGVAPHARATSAAVRPRAFIGSSTEGLAIAEAIQELLDPVAECTIWNQGVFAPSDTTIDSLQDARLLYDFAIVVVTPDDTTTMRGVSAPAPRDNLLFELGLFAGALGRARTFLVLPADSPPRLPTDLSGVTTARFRARSDGNLVAALGPAMSQIMRAMGIDRGGAG
jgi:predicted nucleotide-binding protein